MLGIRNHVASFAAVLALALMAPRGATAQFVVHSNGLPDNQSGLGVNQGYTSANDFTVGHTLTLGSFDWYVLHEGTSGPSSVTSSFFWSILSDVEGRPGIVVASGNVSEAVGSLSSFGCCQVPWAYQTYMFSASVFGTTLGAGTYWLALSDYSSNYASLPQYVNSWASSNGINGNESKRYEGGEWRSVSQEGAFTMYGYDVNAVPEPGTMLLLASGLGGLGGLRRFARRRKS